MTLCDKAVSILATFSSSEPCRRVTGIPVIDATTAAISASVTSSLLTFSDSSQSFFSPAVSSITFRASSLSLAANSYCCALTALSFFSVTTPNLSSSCLIDSGTTTPLIWTFEPASSIKSIALSGKKRSCMYRSLYETHASSAALL